MCWSKTSWLRRLGLLAILALLFGQVALLTHAIDAQHQYGELCQACLFADNLTDAAPVTGAVPIDGGLQRSVLSAGTLIRVARRPTTQRSRSPPTL